MGFEGSAESRILDCCVMPKEGTFRVIIKRYVVSFYPYEGLHSGISMHFKAVLPINGVGLLLIVSAFSSQASYLRFV